MHVVVVGCGRVGSELARALEEADHTVAIIDKNQNAFRRLHASFAGKTLVGLGFDREVLDTAGIDEAGGLAAVTNGDNSNILTARIARENFGIERVVARIYDPRRAVIYQRLGIATVATVAWTTDQVLRRLLPEERRGEWVDATGAVALVERAIPDRWVGHKLEELHDPGHFRVVSVTRFGAAHVATSDVVGQEGDILHLVAEVAALPQLDERLAAGAPR